MTAETLAAVRALVAELGALEATATKGPWKVYADVLEPNELGRQSGIRATATRTQIGTEWTHPQLHGPFPVVTLSSGPYHDPPQRVYIKPEDAALIVALRNALPRLRALVGEG